MKLSQYKLGVIIVLVVIAAVGGALFFRSIVLNAQKKANQHHGVQPTKAEENIAAVAAIVAKDKASTAELAQAKTDLLAQLTKASTTPDKVAILDTLTVVCQKQNDLACANDYQVQALQLDPSNYDSLVSAGEAAQAASKYTDALADFQKALAALDTESKNYAYMKDYVDGKIAELQALIAKPAVKAKAK